MSWSERCIKCGKVFELDDYGSGEEFSQAQREHREECKERHDVEHAKDGGKTNE